MSYRQIYQSSVEGAEAFWAQQAQRIEWQRLPDRVLDNDDPPMSRWFRGGMTNLCFNAVDRHLAERGGSPALIHVSSETQQQRVYTFAELHREVQCAAAMMRGLGIGPGDRVLIYMPMIPEAIFAMLATVRIGAVHSVVFGGFAAHALASRIDDARPKLVLAADAGLRAGKAILYKPLLDEALRISAHAPEKVIVFDRGIDSSLRMQPGRDLDYASLRETYRTAEVPVVWVESSHPSYILYTSGTTGKPKGVQRDTGGYAVALATSMRLIYDCAPGEPYFATSDIGWVVGHSYIVYGPLINGSPTVVYEGLPARPDPGVWWKIVQDHQVRVLFSAPTALRLLKNQDPSFLRRYDLSSLRHVFIAGEPLDEPTHQWIEAELGVPVYDHYWQTETGWPILSPQPGVESLQHKHGSPGLPVYGFDVQLRDQQGGIVQEIGQGGVVTINTPLPPGCLTTVWGQDDRFKETYFEWIDGRPVYSTFDWGSRDADGYFRILGRTDDVINVAGHRLGTREIEEAICRHSAVAECAVVGVRDEIKGQSPVAFVVFKTLESATVSGAELVGQVAKTVDESLGAIARPSRVHAVRQLPKTRSGKVLRRSIQALAEGREPGDLTTLDDPAAMEQIRLALASA